ncbi:calcitonin receptor-like protein 1 [Macrosteles quadrilineatus]|uniref:calcitonin receptor-like protein 1 n=1 Tax=Macrosteles quadrilineatus TaxID=74068 RepID=UPI0023E23837|nr:calcitonin receptor-like protein 1 [Macrosteles quadrilineatus]
MRRKSVAHNRLSQRCCVTECGTNCCQLECFLESHEEEDRRSQQTKPEVLCHRVWDKLLCWPPTLPGTWGRLLCVFYPNDSRDTVVSSNWSVSWRVMRRKSVAHNRPSQKCCVTECGANSAVLASYIAGYLGQTTQLECFLESHEEEERRSQQTKPEVLCHRVWDKLLCWPPTLPGTWGRLLSQLECFLESHEEEERRSQQTKPEVLCHRVWDKLLCWPPTLPGTWDTLLSVFYPNDSCDTLGSSNLSVSWRVMRRKSVAHNRPSQKCCVTECGQLECFLESHEEEERRSQQTKPEVLCHRGWDKLLCWPPRPTLPGTWARLLSQLECFLESHEEEERRSQQTKPEVLCHRVWDKLLCWPPTLPGTWARLPCFSELNGIQYDTTKNATRWCHENGVWDNYTDYTTCREQPASSDNDLQEGEGVEVSTILYFGGHTMSLVALGLAVWIFVYFKDLRCLRNTIHTNLMFTYMLADFMWILTIIVQMTVQMDLTACVMLILLLHYCYLTNFFWMLVEGLYLYTLVVVTFTRDNIKLRAYIVIGWGIPVIVVSVWGIVKGLTDVDVDPQVRSRYANCPWMTPHPYDWIYQAPVAAVLAINLLFLCMIMWVLITKLRSANTLETQQYRKAAKALLVLIPLLGTTYILVIAGPSTGLSANIHAYVRAILISTQGFTVALFYCFLNSEVQTTVRHHLDTWREERHLAMGRRFTYTKDWSPNTRTESIRLCNTKSASKKKFRKRQMSVSEATTMTVVGGVLNKDLVHNKDVLTRTNNGAGTVHTTVIANYETMDEHAV